jgi:hypothetical protein
VLEPAMAGGRHFLWGGIIQQQLQVAALWRPNAPTRALAFDEYCSTLPFWYSHGFLTRSCGASFVATDIPILRSGAFST